MKPLSNIPQKQQSHQGIMGLTLVYGQTLYIGSGLLYYSRKVRFSNVPLIRNLNLRDYSVFQGFSKAKSANGGSILSSSQFMLLPQLPQKIKLMSKVVKSDSKIIISLPKI